MSSWYAYDNGRSIGKVSTEGDVILRDDEHSGGARITLKRGKNYISVSCNLYGKLDHTRFFVTISEAQREYQAMKSAIDDVIDIVASAGSKEIKVWEAISEFVRRFP